MVIRDIDIVLNGTIARILGWLGKILLLKLEIIS